MISTKGDCRVLMVGPLEVICPSCRSELNRLDSGAVCTAGHSFPALQSTIDFLAGEQAPDADAAVTVNHAAEETGAPWRVSKYLIPQLTRLIGAPAGRLVLDDGCGIGSVVSELSRAGVHAFGIDPGSRVQQWETSDVADRLFRADGAKLPFPTSSFDAVVSSGVLEHLGEPQPWKERHPTQVGYISEAIRVLKPGGVALMAAPNGAHPIDYWHGRKLRSFDEITSPMRVHLPYERWMPNSRRVKKWVAESGHAATVTFLTPENYLAFERIQRHWAGRSFTSTMKAVFRQVTKHPTLATTPINPWLVACIRKS